MKILVVNGSPHSEKSSTMALTRAFLTGLKKDCDTTELIDVSKNKIEGCLGCFHCWMTDGECVQKDDMPRLLEQYVKADLVIWSFPLYYYGIPSKLKAFRDRLFLNDYPDMVVGEDGIPGHPSRFDTSKIEHIVISTCGFYTAQGLYDGVLAEFRIVYREMFKEAILCGEGGVFMEGHSSEYTEKRLELVKKAGSEFAESGKISDETKAVLATPVIPPEIYVKRGNENKAFKYKYDHSKD